MGFRTFLAWSSIVVFTLLLGALAFLTFPFDRKGNVIHLYARLWGRLILWASGVKVKVRGFERIAPGRPYIFMANHLSAYDIFVLLSELPVQFRWLAKAELFRIPVLGWAMGTAGYISLDRSEPKKAYRSMEEAARRIREGTSVVIFPEGTRSKDGRLQPFLKGGFTLAVKSQVPIVPISISGTWEIMPPQSRKVRKGDVEVVVGEPIETKGYTMKEREELMKRVSEAIRANLREGRG